jgi:hypothetical protein
VVARRNDDGGPNGGRGWATPGDASQAHSDLLEGPQAAGRPGELVVTRAGRGLRVEVHTENFRGQLPDLAFKYHLQAPPHRLPGKDPC